MPMPKKSDPIKSCAHCGRSIERKRYGGRMEDRQVFLRRRFCDLRCSAAGLRKPDPTRDAYRKRARSLRGSACESCGRTDKLSTHHENRNWRDNSPENLRTLCASCHTSLHHARGDIKPTHSSTVPTVSARSETPCVPAQAARAFLALARRAVT